MELAVAARSDVGMIRAGNEDNFYATADERGGCTATVLRRTR